MISARSRGLPAVAVPGDDAWEPKWARLLTGRRVSVVFDCDRAGRDRELWVEVVQLPAQPLLGTPALVDEVVAMVDEQLQLA